jgi:DNA polymerase III beta subunit, C-terminal domain
MSNTLPATLPVRQSKTLPSELTQTTEPPARGSRVTQTLPSLPGMVLTRKHLAHVVRFASRVTTRSATPGLRSCFLDTDFLVVTNLDISLRTLLPGARNVGVLVPVEVLKRCVGGNERPEVHIVRDQSNPARPFAVRIDGALFSGHDPAEFPAVGALFPDGHSVAHARFQTLEAVLVAASTDEPERSKCGIYFQLCRNVSVATNGHVLHAQALEASGDGDFLVPRKAIDLVEIIRKATKTREVTVAFHADHAVFRIAQFELSARLEKTKFPAWEQVVPKRSKYELRVSKNDLLQALDRVAAAIGDRSRGVVLHRTGERLEIHGENPRAGEIKTDISASGWTDNAVIEVNLSYLYNSARYAPSDELRIAIGENTSPLKIEDGSYLALVMPIGPKKGTKS